MFIVNVVFYKIFWAMMRLGRRNRGVIDNALGKMIAATLFVLLNPISVISYHIIRLSGIEWDGLTNNELAICIFISFAGLIWYFHSNNRWMKVARNHKKYQKRIYTWLVIIMSSLIFIDVFFLPFRNL